MLMVVGYQSGVEAYPDASKLIKKLREYSDDALVRLYDQDPILLGLTGKGVFECLRENEIRNIRSGAVQYLLIYILFVMITRVFLLKNSKEISAVIGYCSGIATYLMAADIMPKVPQDARKFWDDLKEKTKTNTKNDTRGCVVDFSETNWSEFDVVRAAEQVAPNAVFLQDRRGPTILDFVGARPALEAFLNALNAAGGAAVRASGFRLDPGHHSPLGPEIPNEVDAPAWEVVRQRFASSPIKVGTSCGRWWDRDLSAMEIRQRFYEVQTLTLESGKMANMIRDSADPDVKFIGSPLVVREMLAGTGYPFLDATIVQAEML